MNILRSILPTAIVCLIFVFAPLAYGYGQSENEIISSLSVNPVTIDGMWTTEDEWEDAAEFSEEGAIFSIKDDEEFLYVLLDFLGDETLTTGDLGGLSLDMQNCKADSPQVDDISAGLVHGYPTPKNELWVFQGNGTQWTLIWRDTWETDDPLKIVSASTNITENNPYSKSPHVIYEFAIPKKLFRNMSEIGFSAYMEDREASGELRSQVSLPKTADYFPISWATLSFATNVGETVTPTESPTTPTPTETPPRETETPTPTPTQPPIPTQPAVPAQPGLGAQERATIVLIVAIIIIGALLFHRRKKPKKKMRK